MSAELNFLSEDNIQKIRDEKISYTLDGFRDKLSGLDIKTESKEKEPYVHKYEPRYNKFDLAEVARNIYKANIKHPAKEDNPNVDFPELPSEFDHSQPVTHAKIVSAKHLTRALVGIRNGGCAGRPVALAGPNGGNVGIGCNNVSIISTSEDVEYDEDLTFLTEEDAAIAKLEDKLLTMEDISWQAIDKVMRQICREHGMTPKELHKEFKSKHGMIPDDFAKENQMTESVGWFPLDEMARTHPNGMVYEVVFMFRAGRQRLKFFWPSPDEPTEDDMQEACKKFWPGAKLITFYPAHDPANVHNGMVMVPALGENFEVVPDDLWDFMSEDDSEIYDEIATDIGEPITPVYLTEDEEAFTMDVTDHDTGEVLTVMFGEGKRGLWDNIHAKRKRGEKSAKPGDKDYPKTLNVEGLEQARKNVGASKCWPGKKAKGTKMKNGREVPNCVSEEGDMSRVEVKYKRMMDRQETRNEKTQEKAQAKEGKRLSEDMSGMSQKSGDKRSTDSGAGMTAKGVAKYNRRTGGNLKTAVTTPPSKLKPGSKAAGRRKSFCARSRGWNGERGKAARRRWNC